MYSVYVTWQDNSENHMIFFDEEKEEMEKKIDYLKKLKDVIHIKRFIGTTMEILK